jgi:hypothetical protein
METSADRLMHAIEEQKKIDKLTNNERIVYNVIMANEGVQNDEKTLLEAVWVSQGWSQDSSLYYNLTRVMHPESVSRCRRTLHTLGLITYSKDAEKRRYEAYKEETARHSNWGSFFGR